MRDPYDILGVGRDADADSIKRAYRGLAKKYHPDLHPGDSQNDRQFKELNGAYDLLSDPDKRRRFDRGEIDAHGNERPQRARRPTWATGESPSARAGFGRVDPDELLDEILRGSRARAGAKANPGGAGAKRRGADVTVSVSVDFAAAAGGTRRRVTLPDGRTVEVTVPPGTVDGTRLRLAGQGQTGVAGGAAGDAFVEIMVEPNKLFERRGRDIHLTLPITLAEAVLGAAIVVPTIDGKVQVKVPKGSNTGSVLRLRGKGVPAAGDLPAGDQLVTLSVVLPDQPDAELTNFLEKWSRSNAYDVRRKAGLES
jgi:DnaJ-class molecular chaperone